MNQIRIETGPAKDKYVYGGFLFATLDFTEEELTIGLGPDCPNSDRETCRLWEHTVWELENLALGLRFVAEGGLPDTYVVPSPDVLIGPFASLRPALEFQLGMPGIGVDGHGTSIYCSRKLARRAGRRLVYLEAMNDHGTARAIFEIEDVLAISDRLYEMARGLAPRLVLDEIAEE